MKNREGVYIRREEIGRRPEGQPGKVNQVTATQNDRGGIFGRLKNKYLIPASVAAVATATVGAGLALAYCDNDRSTSQEYYSLPTPESVLEQIPNRAFQQETREVFGQVKSITPQAPADSMYMTRSTMTQVFNGDVHGLSIEGDDDVSRGGIPDSASHVRLRDERITGSVRYASGDYSSYITRKVFSMSPVNQGTTVRAGQPYEITGFGLNRQDALFDALTSATHMRQEVSPDEPPRLDDNLLSLKEDKTEIVRTGKGACIEDYKIIDSKIQKANGFLSDSQRLRVRIQGCTFIPDM